MWLFSPGKTIFHHRVSPFWLVSAFLLAWIARQIVSDIDDVARARNVIKQQFSPSTSGRSDTRKAFLETPHSPVVSALHPATPNVCCLAHSLRLLSQLISMPLRNSRPRRCRSRCCCSPLLPVVRCLTSTMLLTSRPYDVWPASRLGRSICHRWTRHLCSRFRRDSRWSVAEKHRSAPRTFVCSAPMDRLWTAWSDSAKLWAFDGDNWNVAICSEGRSRGGTI